ncbi:MAG: CPBP family intramembrane metalloprotease [Lentimicrobium sp.]|nr:CPBP family intramembrane metalloprotease [Lentimicrobium sp.]
MIQSLGIDLSWQKGDQETVVPIISAILFFIIYWFTAGSAKVRKYFYQKTDSDQASVNHITFNRIFGFITMGVLPALLFLLMVPDYSLANLGVNWIPETTMYSVLWTVGLWIVVIPLAYISAQKPENLVNYPMIRAVIWTNRTVGINIAGWALYLLGYEFLFRGVLLFPLAASLGIWTAIAINVALYSATHIPKGLTETLGAIPLGLVLCILTIKSGTIWIAFLVHLGMALTNSFTALKFHPDIHYKRSQT